MTPSPFAPVIPESAPFSPEQRAWLNGFFAGLCSRGPAPAPAAAPAAELAPLTILFGSQTGTAEALAKRAAKEAGKRGFAPTVIDMGDFSTDRLAREKNLLILTSTFGEGEPPDNAKALHAALARDGAPLLAGLRFSVCGLGDTQYTQFCRCGQDFDLRLEALGAARAAPRADCDLEYEEPFRAWLDAALAALASGGDRPQVREAVPAASAVAAEQERGFSKNRPFPARVVEVRTLNGSGSSKEVNHVELSLAGSGLAYEAGDALGVMPQNCPELVGEVLEALGRDGEEAVPGPDGASTPLRRALTEGYDLGKPTPALMELLSVAAAIPANGGGAPSDGPHVIDALLSRPGAKLQPQDFVRALRKLQPRLYSISSSPKAHPDAVHLTIAAVRYEADGRRRKGTCSTFVAERALAAGKIGIFVHANKAFRPPADPGAPMIMIGPGTGIAPFRAFLQERRATGAKGRNWLFFGDQRASTDFLYREELEGMVRSALLNRLDTAFSRDQADKVYVQHRMLEQAGELFAWLETGAHVYVCGDASRMAKDVDAALHRSIEIGGGWSRERAADYVQALRASKRYARDVY